MPTVETVKGAVDTASLGQTLMHEHVFILTAEVEQNWPGFSWGGSKEEVFKRSVEKLKDLKSRGFDTIVDLTAVGLGRCIPAVAAVNAEVDLNIIVATGLYTFDELPHFIEGRPPVDGAKDVLVDMFISDIEVGSPETHVKAGILKCCTEVQGVTPNIDRVLRAIARAHRWTGVPISTHTNAKSRTGLEQQRVFKEEGVDLSRVVIGHCGDTTDVDYLRELLDNGSTIGADRFGQYPRFEGDPYGDATFDERVDTVVRLCELGYAGQIVLSHDANCYLDYSDTLDEIWPEWTYNHISDKVVPALLERGVSQAQVDQMLIDNPRRIFEQKGGY
jgi:phosphotriesterase-related protein